LWDSAFFREFNVEKGIQKKNLKEQQVGFMPAMQRMFYRYFKYILFRAKAISRSPVFFACWLDVDSDDSMISEGIKKSWNSSHWESCGWYLDCPSSKPPSFDIALRDSIEPSMIGTQKVSPVPAKKTVVSRTKGSKKDSSKTAKIMEATTVLKTPPVVQPDEVLSGLESSSPTVLTNPQPSPAPTVVPSMITSQHIKAKKTCKFVKTTASSSPCSSSTVLLEQTSLAEILDIGLSHSALTKLHDFVTKVKCFFEVRLLSGLSQRLYFDNCQVD
jgi:hypothetical protein